MKYNKIKVKFFALLIIILLPIIIYEILSISGNKEQIIQNKLDSSVYLSEAIANSFGEYIDGLWIQQDIISTYMLSNPDFTTEQISDYLKQVVEKQETVQNLYWLNDKGVVIASSRLNMTGKSLGDSDYVQRIIEGESKVLSDLDDGFTDNDPILPVAKAIKKDDTLVGIMLANINVEMMGTQFSSLLFDEGEIFTIIDTKGTIIYSNNSPGIYRDKRQIPADSPTWGALKGNIIKTKKKFFEGEGIYRLGCSYPIRETGWALSVGAKYDDVIESVNKKTSDAVVLLELLLFISFLMAISIGDYLITPIIELKDAAYKIMNGDYSVRTNIKGYDEIAITAQTFDNMAESIEKNDKQKSQFFVNLSHELKTPLNVILASLQLIDKVHVETECCPKYPKIREQLFLMRQNSYRLIRMVSNLIDLSKHDNGYLNLQLGNYNIVKIIEDITMSIVKYAETKKIDILFDTDTEEKIIACNPDAIERIMLNLISNSLKFTEEGGSIFINLYSREDNIIICVKDTGIGIPEDSIDSIFDRFKQVDSSLTRNREGSGIGLSLVKALIEVHGGSIKVNSIPNEGAEFVIDLPVKLIKDKEVMKNNKPEYSNNRMVEKIDLEFSDIYGL